MRFRRGEALSPGEIITKIRRRKSPTFQLLNHSSERFAKRIFACERFAPFV